MPQLPAHCGTCNLTFFSGFDIDEGSDMTFIGCMSSCPRCGAAAPIAEGTFDQVDGGFKQTGGKPVDPELFTRLGLILIQAKLDHLKPHEIVRRR